MSLKIKIAVLMALGLFNFSTHAQQLPLSDVELKKKSIHSRFMEGNEEEVFRLHVQNPGSFPANISKYKNLHELIIWGNDWDYSLNSIPEEFYNLPYITVFRISNTDISEISPSIIKWKYIREISLRSNRISRLPDEISMVKSLEEFTFDNNIAQMPIIPSVKKLEVSIYQDSTASNWVDKFPSAEILRLQSWNANQHTTELIPLIASKMQLKELYLDGIDIDSAGWEALAGEKLLTHLSVPSGCFSLQLAPQFSELKRLEIKNPTLYGQKSKDVFKSIAALTHLEMFTTEFHQEDVDGYLLLTNLDIRFNDTFDKQQFTKYGTYLIDVKGLKELSIKDVAPHISKFTQLKVLDIGNVDNADFQLVFQWIKPLTQLETLYIQNVAFMSDYSHFSQLNQLKTCYVYNDGWYTEPLNDEQKQQLRNTLKNCTFIFLE